MVKSEPASRSDHTAVAMPALELSAGGVIDHPEVVPNPRELVAVNVAPPVARTTPGAVHVAVHAPRWARDSQGRSTIRANGYRIGLGSGPRKRRCNRYGLADLYCPSGPYVKLIARYACTRLPKKHALIGVVALRVMLLNVTAPLENTMSFIAVVGGRITVLAEFLLKVSPDAVAI